MNVEFDSVWFQNFMSFGNSLTTVDLSKPSTTLIVGLNIDEGGSSGAGKSTIMNALGLALYDVTPDGINKDMIINNVNAGKSILTRVGTKFVADGKTYVINRYRGVRTDVELTEDGKDITPANIKLMNELIVEKLGFSYALYQQVISFNGNSRPFLSLPGGEQRDVIEELLRITLLSRKADALKLQMKHTESELKVQIALAEQAKTQDEKHQQLIKTAEQRIEQWDIQRTTRLKQARDTLDALNRVDFESEEQLHLLIADLMNQQQPIDSAIAQLNQEKLHHQKQTWPSISDFRMIESELKQADQLLSKLKTEFSHLKDAKCPYCLQDYAEARSKLIDLGQKIQDTDTLVKDLTLTRDEMSLDKIKWDEESSIKTKDIADKLTEQSVLKKEQMVQLNELSAALTYKTLKDHTQASHMALNVTTNITNIEAEINPHIEALAQLKQTGSIKPNTTLIDELSRIKDHQKVLLKLLTDKSSFIRKGIISKTLPFLNRRLSYYTAKLMLPHNVAFMSDLSCEITKQGLALGHGNLSNGEKKRLNLGLCMAFRDALTYLHSKVNLLLTDEVDGGSLCDFTVEKLADLIKEKAHTDNITCYCISHNPIFQDRMGKRVYVKKEKSFSVLTTMP